jgi:hypothetical protein
MVEVALFCLSCHLSELDLLATFGRCLRSSIIWDMMRNVGYKSRTGSI